MPTRFIDGLAVEVDGDGPNVVCIHGLGGSSNTWTPLMPGMRDARVIRIDLPGSGRSATVPGMLSIEGMADAVISVCRQLGVGSAQFLGHSMGSIVCQHVAARQGGLVRKMALFGPLACPPEAARAALRARAQKAMDGGVLAMQEIADAIVQGALSRSTKEELPVVVAMVRESLMRQDSHGYAKSCSALAMAQSAPLEEIDVPVLLVTGDEDAVAPPDTVRDMARRLPNAREVVLHRCGHWTPFERAGECASELRNFLTW
jgi:3-oxoadipate enol-lactonase